MNDGLIHFFQQNLWANLRLLDECASLSDAQLDATLDGTYGSVRVTLMHIFAGEESYVQHFTGQRPEPALRPNNPFVGFDALRERARMNGESLIALAGQWEEGDMVHIPEDGRDFRHSRHYCVNSGYQSRDRPSLADSHDTWYAGY